MEILESVTDEQVRRRPATGTWAPIEYAAHVADAVAWYTQRVERVLQEAAPRLEPFDFDAAAEVQGYCRRNIGTVTTDVSRACAELADLAMRVGPVELRRCGRGSDGSPRSVASLLARAHHELVHHELDLRRGVELALPTLPRE
ncbi:DinB family protein [Mycolicibacter icosiumassiliensis]|uniref:DinB family protein n=1 Tax=Mycolicibacter icosiumassiliensis TaxID=1792835 RepID=UPI00083259A1|nr:DinB family protein [Mycolicibacter icosiumassiliensis]